MDRLDKALVDRGLCESRTRAQREVLAGNVLVNGKVCAKVSHKITQNDMITVSGTACPYVGMAALKLVHLLDDAGISCEGADCLDIGASTGGFTQILLERGAKKVTAVDVGTDQLHPSLRTDMRIELHENTDIRDFVKTITVPFDIITADVSFISIKTIIPVIASIGKLFILLIKPQFETPPEAKNKRGVVTDPVLHKEVLVSVTACLQENGLYPQFITASRILGGSGNKEFFIVTKKMDLL